MITVILMCTFLGLPQEIQMTFAFPEDAVLAFDRISPQCEMTKIIEVRPFEHEVSE